MFNISRTEFVSHLPTYRSIIAFVAFVAALLSFLVLLDRYAVPQLAAPDATTFFVTNTDNNGPGSLRQAINDSNSNPGTDTIAFNIPGAGVHTISPAAALPALSDPVVIDGYTQPGASPNTLAQGNNAVLLIELTGVNFGSNNVNAPGLKILGQNCTVRGLVINRFVGTPAIDIGQPTTPISGNRIEGNFLGTDPSGSIQRSNDEGVRVGFATNTTIGGTTPAARNVISANYIGVNLTTGSSTTSVQGNFIGTNAAGTAALGNTSDGIFSGGNGSDVIGGTTDGARNVIAATQFNAGIFVSVATNGTTTTIQNNYIGTDVSGTVALGNFFGIWINNGSNSSTTIGGSIPPARNLISGNNSDGIFISQSSRNSVMTGNFIGTDASGTKPLPNAGNGVRIETGNNRVGGTIPSDGNTIAFNGKNGVLLFSGIGINNSIRRNSIFSNGLLGIDQIGDGVTLNDSGDADIGPNNLQNYPILTAVTTSPTGTTVTGSLDSTPNSSFNLNFYASSGCDASGYGEGTTPLVSIPVTTNANGNSNFGVAFSIPVGPDQVITATTTDSAGNTSEFSPCNPVDGSGSVQFSTGALKVNEDVGFITVSALRQGGSRGSLTVNYATADISAMAGSDYVPQAGTLTFNDGETLKTLDIPILDDGVIEPDKAFVIRLSNGPKIDSISSPVEEVITIQDRIVPPALSVNDATITEGNAGTTNLSFTVSLSALTGRTVTVDYQTIEFSAQSAVDYQPVSGSLTFDPHQTTRTVVVPIIGDTIDEFEESLRLQLSNPNNATLDRLRGVGTISDDDAPPTASLRDVTVVEGNSGVTLARFNISLSQKSGKEICLQGFTADGTATAGSGDYKAVTPSITNPPQNIILTPGVSSTTFTVQVNGDVEFESTETFLGNINACNTGVVIIARGQAVGTIINDDPQSLPSISITDVGVSDGSGAANAVFDVALSAASNTAVTVAFATAEGTATAADFTPVSGTLTFDPTVTHRSITVPIVPDAAAEGNETFTVNLTNPAAAFIADAQGLATISDGPPNQLPFLTINDITVLEGASGQNEVAFRVSLSQASAQPVSFQYTIAPGTATENVDYMKVFGGATIFSGETSVTIIVPIVGDQIAEPDETFFLNISNPNAATIADDQGKATIINYVQPSLQFSVAALGVTEDVGSALLTVTRSANNLTTSTVEVATVNGTASQRTDYTISAAFLTFLPGESSRNFRVPIIDDVYQESIETFDVVQQSWRRCFGKRHDQHCKHH